MTSDIFILIAIMSAWLLIVFSISEFLERFKKQRTKDSDLINYGLKGTLYLYSILVWIYSICVSACATIRAMASTDCTG